MSAGNRVTGRCEGQGRGPSEDHHNNGGRLGLKGRGYDGKAVATVIMGSKELELGMPSSALDRPGAGSAVALNCNRTSSQQSRLAASWALAQWHPGRRRQPVRGTEGGRPLALRWSP